MMVSRTLACFIALGFVGCASVGARIDPGSGTYELVIGATDCIDQKNILGSAVTAIPGLGPWAVSNFGCNN